MPFKSVIAMAYLLVLAETAISPGDFCGDERCNLKCKAGEKCVEHEEVQCVQAPCCPRWTCVEELCLGKPCGAFCDTSLGLLQAIRYCQPDGTCGLNSKPNCTEELKEEGESCGSCFCPPTYNAGTCKPGLTCVHDPLIADLPGTCTRTNCESCESMVQGQKCGQDGGPFRMNCTHCCRTSPSQCAEWRCDAGGWLCQKPCPTVDPCSEPFAVVGPCEAIFPSWSYNQQTGKCEYFDYGGCEGNNNKFESKQECQKTCETTEVGCEDVRKCNMAFGRGEVGVCIQTNKEGWNVQTDIDWSAAMKTGLCKSKDDTDASCCGCFKQKVDRCEDPKCVSIPKKKISRECIKKSEYAPANFFNTGRKCQKRDDCFCFQNCKTTKKCKKSGGKCLGKAPQWPYQKPIKPCDRKMKCSCYIPISLIIPG